MLAKRLAVRTVWAANQLFNGAVTAATAWTSILCLGGFHGEDKYRLFRPSIH
jgi:hypothetical protein